MIKLAPQKPILLLYDHSLQGIKKFKKLWMNLKSYLK